MFQFLRSKSQEKSIEELAQLKQKRVVAEKQERKLVQDQKFYSQEVIQLPPNFAEELLELELEIELPNLKMESVTRLLTLYQVLQSEYDFQKQGVEFFSSIKSDKYLVFKNKIQSLLLKPNVINIMNDQQKPQQTQLRSNSAIKMKELDNKLKQHDTKEQVQIFLNSHKSEMEKINNLIQGDMAVQQQRLKDRIGKRFNDPQKANFALTKSTSFVSMVKYQNQVEDSIGNGKNKYKQEHSLQPSPNNSFLKSDEKKFETIKVDQERSQPTLMMNFKKKSEGNPQQVTQSLDSDTLKQLLSQKQKKIQEIVQKSEQLQRQKNDLFERNQIMF